MFEVQRSLSEHPDKIGDLFRMLQDISGEAAARWNASGEDIKEKGLMWVIIRYDIRLARMLRAGEPLAFLTWASPVRHRMSQRHYVASDESGECVLSGSGIWAVVDYNTRSMIDPSKRDVLIHGEVTGQEQPRPETPVHLPLTSQTDYVVTDSVLDINGHMNNTRYFDLVQDCIREETEELSLRRVRAVFNNEAREGDTIRVSWGRDENKWFFSGEKNSGLCFQIGFEFDIKQ